jgi:hypothetical protein
VKIGVFERVWSRRKKVGGEEKDLGLKVITIYIYTSLFKQRTCPTINNDSIS